MPWYAAAEQRGPNAFWLVERPSASPQDAYDAARNDARSEDRWTQLTITVFEAEDAAHAKYEAIRRGLDWRMRGQDRWLKGVMLTWKRYDGPDHDHCEFCWRKFLNRDDPEIGPEWFEDDYVDDAGYAVLVHGEFRTYYRWICRYCFPDFVSVFEWNVVDTPA